MSKLPISLVGKKVGNRVGKRVGKSNFKTLIKPSKFFFDLEKHKSYLIYERIKSVCN